MMEKLTASPMDSNSAGSSRNMLEESLALQRGGIASAHGEDAIQGRQDDRLAGLCRDGEHAEAVPPRSALPKHLIARRDVFLSLGAALVVRPVHLRANQIAKAGEGHRFSV